MSVSVNDYSSHQSNSDKVGKEQIMYVVRDDSNARVQYVGFSTKMNPSESDKVFKIKQVIMNDGEGIEKWSGTKFDKAWEDRTTIFPGLDDASTESVVTAFDCILLFFQNLIYDESLTTPTIDTSDYLVDSEGFFIFSNTGDVLAED